MSSVVAERIELEIEGQTVIIERLEDGTFRKPAYLAGAEREVVGPSPNRRASHARANGIVNKQTSPDSENYCITAPATDAAQLWDGWGTALKPAYEPVLLCAKPLTVEHLFGIMVDDITNTLQEVLECFGLSASDVAKSFSGIRAKLKRAQVYTVHENARINVWENTESVQYVANSFTFSGQGSSEQTRTKASSAPSNARANGNQNIIGEKPTLAGEVDNILMRIQDISMSVITGDISESTGLLWNNTSDALLSQVNTFTIEMGIKLTTALRTLKSFLTQTISSDTGNLSPEYSPIIVAMKPREGTFAENALEWGVAGIWVDGCRVGTNEENLQRPERRGLGTTGGWANYSQEPGTYGTPPGQGRWPANLVLSHTPECRQVGVRKVKGSNGVRGGRETTENWRMHHETGQEVGYASPDGTETVPAWECAPGCPVAMLDEMSGESVSKATPRHNGHFNSVAKGYEYPHTTHGHNDTGGASRFFYTAKASRSEREAGLLGRIPCLKCGGLDTETHIDPKTGKEVKCRRNGHPTVKPLELMRWLCRLTATPTGGVVLDPFMGSGRTGMAAVLEDRKFVGIELERESFEIAEAAIEWAQEQVPEMVQAEMAI